MLEVVGVNGGNIRNLRDYEMGVEFLQGEVDLVGGGIAVDADVLVAQARFHEAAGGAAFIGDVGGELRARVLHFFQFAGKVGFVADTRDEDALGGEGVTRVRAEVRSSKFGVWK